MLMLRLTQAFKKEKLDFAIVGGLAVNLHGASRGTVDIDLIIKFNEKDFKKAQSVLAQLGLQPRLPMKASEVFHFRSEYIEKRNLIAWSFVNPKNPAEVVDLLLTHDLKHEQIQQFSFMGEKIPVIDLDGLIKMKEQSARPQDLEDVKALLEIKNEKKK